jgi:peptidoglycan/xylan/chitin deacetylase (PgdA/CDA1 family)
MKKLFKWFLAIILYYSGILWWFERLSRYSREGFWILGYYRVSDKEEDSLKTVITLKHFKKQMCYLKKNYNVISLRELVEKVETYQPLPRRSIAITFDNGYKNIYFSVSPVLKELNIPATVFLVTDYVDTENLLWFDEIIELIETSPLKEIVLKFENFEETYNLVNMYSKNKLTSRLLEITRATDFRERKRYIYELKILLQANKVINSEKVLLNWHEIREMSNNNIDFGSHGRTYTELDALNAADLESEIYSSKKTIEQNVGKPVVLFSYPTGRECDINYFVIHKLQEAGYKAACMNVLGKNKNKRDLFRLKRRGIEKISSTSFFGLFSKALFACEISGIFDLIFIRRERGENVY